MELDKDTIAKLRRDRAYRSGSIMATVIGLGLDHERREHEVFTRDAWRRAVAREETSVGYIDWLSDQLTGQQI